MSPLESEDIKAIRSTLEKLASAEVFEASKSVYEFARNAFNQGNYASCLALCDRAVELDDPVFSTLALTIIPEVWRRLGAPEKELAGYLKIATLQDKRRRFVDPLSLGVAMSRAGLPNEAKKHYLEVMGLYTDPSSAQANLTELLLTLHEYRECIDWSNRLLIYPSAAKQVIARAFRASALFLSGDKGKADEEFQWLGKYLVAAGSIPADFSWDFGDSATTLNAVDLPSGLAVIQVLSKQITFSEFAARWASLYPTLSAPSQPAVAS